MPFIKHAPQRGGAVSDDDATLETLLEQLDSLDARLRRGAASALGDWPESVPALLALLDRETGQAVRSAALDALGRIASEESVAGLARCLRSEDAWLRNAAIEVLRGLPDQVAGAVAQLLVDPGRDVRILAVGILDSLRHERVEEWLLQLIDADADVNVCGAALDVLAGVASAAARAPVARVLARFPDEPYIAFAGGLALKRLET